MPQWLFKQEPSDYSYADLERDGETTWNGVTNALAVKHLKACAVGDKVFFYETGDVKAVVGIATITTAPIPDPENEKSVVLNLKAANRLKNPVTLAAIKADERFAEWELVRISRLSVMPVPAPLWKAIETMSKKS